MQTVKLWGALVGLMMLLTGGTVGPHPASALNRRPPAHERHAQGNLAGSLGTPAATCILVDGGEVTGSVTSGGQPVPDGLPVLATFTGGPTPVTAVRDGRYALPQLARACSDGIHWIDYELRAGGVGLFVQPTQWQTTLDLDVTSAASPSDGFAAQGNVPPLCSLVLGTVGGTVMMGDTPVPDGTRVSAVMGPEVSTFSQSVETSGGRYMFTTAGTRCGDRAPNFLSMTVTVAGVATQLVPDRSDAMLDIQLMP